MKNRREDPTADPPDFRGPGPGGGKDGGRISENSRPPGMDFLLLSFEKDGVRCYMPERLFFLLTVKKISKNA